MIHISDLQNKCANKAQYKCAHNLQMRNGQADNLQPHIYEDNWENRLNLSLGRL